MTKNHFNYEKRDRLTKNRKQTTKEKVKSRQYIYIFYFNNNSNTIFYMKKIDLGVNTLGFKEVKITDERLKAGVDTIINIFSTEEVKSIETETELFTYIKDNYIPDLELAKDKYSAYDCFSKDNKMVIELKCRRSHYDTLFIEKMKYDKLIALGCEVRYVNSTPKGVYSFNLNTLEPKWVDRTMKKQTDFSNNNKVVKKVMELKVSSAFKMLK